MNKYFKPIDIIASALDAAGIENTCHPCYDGYQLRFNWCNGDVACHSGTYGSTMGMVETFRFPWDDDDVSMLSPAMTIEKIINFYNSTIIIILPKTP